MSLRVSVAPHLVCRDNTRRLMLDVLLALLPTTAAGLYLFGARAAVLVCASVLTAAVCELVWQKLMKQPVRIGDLSAVVTGLILALNLPANAPVWMAVLGSAVAIILVKQLFGGLGGNFMNPAMFARAVLLASWPVHMTKYMLPQRTLFVAGAETAADTIASATPLLKGGIPMMDLFLGNIPGTIGEVCKAAILLGFAYLVVRKTISWHVPVFFVGTVAVMTWLLGKDALTAVLSGGVLFGAVFMATDYVTNPMFRAGQCVFGAMCGLIVVVIRFWGGYPEGVTYAILFMNCVTPLIDRFSKRRIYGEVKKHA